MPLARAMTYEPRGVSPLGRAVMPLVGGVSPLGRGMMRAGRAVMQTEVQETQIATGVVQLAMEMPPVGSGMSHLAP